jgi:hypothetical protein
LLCPAMRFPSSMGSETFSGSGSPARAVRDTAPDSWTILQEKRYDGVAISDQATTFTGRDAPDTFFAGYPAGRISGASLFTRMSLVTHSKSKHF